MRSVVWLAFHTLVWVTGGAVASREIWTTSLREHARTTGPCRLPCRPRLSRAASGPKSHTLACRVAVVTRSDMCGSGRAIDDRNAPCAGNPPGVAGGLEVMSVWRVRSRGRDIRLPVSGRHPGARHDRLDHRCDDLRTTIPCAIASPAPSRATCVWGRAQNFAVVIEPVLRSAAGPRTARAVRRPDWASHAKGHSCQSA